MEKETNVTIVVNGLRWQHLVGVMFYSLFLYKDGMSLEQVVVAWLLGTLFLYLGDRQ